jgi:hypothetical protein
MGLVSSISSIVSPGDKPVTAALAMYDPISGESDGAFQAFQYFPEKITDSKGVDYASKTIPGGSHPIYTFISGGERTVTFDAIFANDDNPNSGATVKNFLTGKASFSPLSLTKVRPDVVNIPEAIKWLRSFLYPEYKNNVAKAPPLVVLYLPNSGIVGVGDYPDSIVGILTRADVSYEAFHRDGTPRLVVLNLEIKEVPQIKQQWKFQSREEFLGAVENDHGFSKPYYERAAQQATKKQSNSDADRLTSAIPRRGPIAR